VAVRLQELHAEGQPVWAGTVIRPTAISGPGSQTSRPADLSAHTPLISLA
jgi:hypothetical protein